MSYWFPLKVPIYNATLFMFQPQFPLFANTITNGLFYNATEAIF